MLNYNSVSNQNLWVCVLTSTYIGQRFKKKKKINRRKLKKFNMNKWGIMEHSLYSTIRKRSRLNIFCHNFTSSCNIWSRVVKYIFSARLTGNIWQKRQKNKCIGFKKNTRLMMLTVPVHSLQCRYGPSQFDITSALVRQLTSLLDDESPVIKKLFVQLKPKGNYGK